MEVVTLSLALIVIVLALIKLIIEQPIILLVGIVASLTIFVSFWVLPVFILILNLISIFMHYFIQD